MKIAGLSTPLPEQDMRFAIGDTVSDEVRIRWPHALVLHLHVVGHHDVSQHRL